MRVAAPVSTSPSRVNSTIRWAARQRELERLAALRRHRDGAGRHALRRHAGGLGPQRGDVRAPDVVDEVVLEGPQQHERGDRRA